VRVTDKFEESKENKLEYTEVFDSYTGMVEKSLEDRLSKKISVSMQYITYVFVCGAYLPVNVLVQGFTMDKLERIVVEKKGTIPWQ